MTAKIDKAALAVAVQKIAKLRVEDVGGRKERPAETVRSCLNRGYASLGSDEGLSYILRHAVKYYLEAAALPHTQQPTHLLQAYIEVVDAAIETSRQLYCLPANKRYGPQTILDMVKAEDLAVAIEILEASRHPTQQPPHAGDGQ